MTAPDYGDGDGAPPSTFHGLVSDGSAPPAATPPPAAPVAAASRYRAGGELGTGGMGRVRAAFDGLLEREIAIKEPRARDPAAAAALLREAQVTARLDHPGIVAVLDAGIGADGQVFYAMRIVRGASLDELIAAAPGPRARRAHLRRLVQAIQAVAYAHAHGVVHRDLSPRNVRVGAHGEVVVMDWGLATTVDDAARGGVVCGTPGYRSPELERGAPAGPASDVWSLGALIHLAATGAPPTAPPRRLPSELAAIVRRALAPRPTDRYRDAGELARDLAAYLDGERVAAHRDRPWDPVVRLARRRPGVVATAGASIALIAVVAVTLGALAGRRASEARRARGEAQAALRVMVLELAAQAVRDDRRPDALALAARARALGAVAEAAGLEAAFAASPAPALTRIADEAGCRTLAARTGGDRLCVIDGAVWLDRGGRRTAIDLGGRRPLAARFVDDGFAIASEHAGDQAVARFDGGGRELARQALTGGQVSLDVAAGWVVAAVAEDVVAIAADGTTETWRPCPPGVPIRVAAAHPGAGAGRAHVVAVCSDQTIATLRDGVATRIAPPDLPVRLAAAAAGALVDDAHLVIATSDGQVGVVSLTEGRVLHVSLSPVGPVRRVEVDRRGTAVVVGDGGVAVWRARHGAWGPYVEDRGGLDASLDGERAIVFGAGTVDAWDAVGTSAVHRVRASGGIATARVSPDGRRAAFGAGDGSVLLLTLATGELRRLALADQVVKTFAFSPDGRWLVVGVAGGDRGLIVLELATFTVVDGPWTDPVYRVARAELVSPGVVLAFTYGDAPVRFDLAARRELTRVLLPQQGVRDASAAVGATAAFALDPSGRLWRITADGNQPLRDPGGASRVAVADDGHVMALATPGGDVELRDPRADTTTGRLRAPGAAIETIALDASGRRLAVGRVDGVVEVWDVGRGRVTLRLQAHRSRAAALAFAPDGCTLISGGWDGLGHLLRLCR